MATYKHIIFFLSNRKEVRAIEKISIIGIIISKNVVQTLSRKGLPWYCIHYFYNSVKLKTAAAASVVFWCIKPGVADPGRDDPDPDRTLQKNRIWFGP